MRLFPFDNDNIFVETSGELNLTDRAKLMLIIRDYNMDTNLIKNPKQKIVAEKKNHDILRQTRNYDMITFNINGDVIDVSNLEPIDIKSNQNQPTEVLDIRDLI